MKESTIEKSFTKKIEALGGVCWKLTVPGRAGVPDRLVLFPGGRCSFVELKASGQKPRALQVKRIRDLRALGFTVLIVDSIEGATAAAKRLEAERHNSL